MPDPNSRREALYDALASRILVLDGAMGTEMQRCDLHAPDFGGAEFEGCNENLNLTRPDVVLKVHRDYLTAGADIIETNTFGSMSVQLADYGLETQAYEISAAASRLARQAADEFSTPLKPRFVAASIGPTSKTVALIGNISFDDLAASYFEQFRGLIDGGADILLIETCLDTLNIKAALHARARLVKNLGRPIPAMVSGTIENMGTMLGGQPADALYTSVAHADLLSFGLNCASGPEFMTDHIRTLNEIAETRISCYPNAGIPNDEGKFLETPTSLASQLERFVISGWLNIVGGCCGTTPTHIKAIAEMVAGKKPRANRPKAHRACYSGVELIEADDSNRPLIVGERTNVIGSRLFKNLIAEEKWDPAIDIARRQVRNGAHIVDVCLQSADRDEINDIPHFYGLLVRSAIKAPIMIDTTDPKAVELSLKYCQGKSIINSVNLEDGEEKFELLCPVAKSYGAALVVGTIDEDPIQAQAFTRERKLEVAKRSVDLLTTKYEIPVEDLIIDPLVFPCATGDENYIGGAVETIEALRLIKENIPYVKTVLGVSNISFGLPAAAREIVNSVFLYYCTKAGLDLAIVNAEKLERFAGIPEHERRLAEHLLFNSPPIDVPADHANFDLLQSVPEDWRLQPKAQRAAVNQFHIGAITDHFRKAAPKVKAKSADLPLDERLASYIIQGSKDGLVEDLDRKRAEGANPLDIINGPLMAGMSEVGRLFNNNELIVAEVLQSAEAMKTGVAHLEQFMEKADTAARGKIVLATVKGDVHDIGKNLVEIILANNGFTVVNLGIKILPETLIQAFREHQPDAIGLSGLLVKSTQQMVITAGDFKAAGIRVPLLVGGAALSEKFSKTRIAPEYSSPTFYCKDAMTGLRVMNEITDPATRETALAGATWEEGSAAPAAPAEAVNTSEHRAPKVRIDLPIPPAPYYERKKRDIPQLTELWSYINPFMLFGRHLGFKGNFEKLLVERDPKAIELFQQVEDVKHWAAGFLKARAVWQFFEVERAGNAIHLFEHQAATPIHTFQFGRQPKDDGLCLSDYILPVADDGRRDHIALLVVTAGEGIRERAEECKAKGEYLKAHAVQALAIETAEGAAEWLHRRIREDWGFPDSPTMTMQERFTSRYRGKRYSFGYPACPNLDDQQGIWKLINPNEIGVELTDGMMMEPEASVSALVFQHPDCAYFTASALEMAEV